MRHSLLLRLVGMVIFAALGAWGGYALGRVFESAAPDAADPGLSLRLAVVCFLGGLGIGAVISPHLTFAPYRWFSARVRQIPAQRLIAGTLGLLIGLVIAVLVAFPLSLLPDPLGQVLPFAGSVLFAWMGVTAVVLREHDLSALLGRRVERDVGERSDGAEPRGVVLLDTSVIIDGRIADIARTGFIERTMLVPQFVLSEVQYFADSADRLKRNRGQRGLEILNRLQKEATTPVKISDMEVEGVREVDAKLVRLAKNLQCPIITNDYKLNQVAVLQGVRVLNINELANTVKTVVLPGETMTVQIIQEGREAGQGVGYLDDGTMIVVEDGRRHLNETLDVVVTRVLQTAAGRMIFAQLEDKSGGPRTAR